MSFKASAVANANIALVKYWGKRNEELILPQNSSISMTVAGLQSYCTVEFDENFERDFLNLNGKDIDPDRKEFKNVQRFLDAVRQYYGKKIYAKVYGKNNFPTAAGLASSSSAFAALATACNKALNLGLNKKEISMLARRGSGSASRSCFGGFAELLKGNKEDGSDSYAIQLADENYWPEFRMLFCITSKAEKKIKSRVGMKQTVATCPLYKCWLESVEEDLENVRKGIKNKDFSLVGRTAEHNCLKMHATMMTTKPPIIYWNRTTMDIIHKVFELRDSGLECYFTIDGGPQVKIICLDKDIGNIKNTLQKEIEGIIDFIETKSGTGPKVVEEHLF